MVLIVQVWVSLFVGLMCIVWVAAVVLPFVFLEGRPRDQPRDRASRMYSRYRTAGAASTVAIPGNLKRSRRTDSTWPIPHAPGHIRDWASGPRQVLPQGSPPSLFRTRRRHLDFCPCSAFSRSTGKIRRSLATQPSRLGTSTSSPLRRPGSTGGCAKSSR